MGKRTTDSRRRSKEQERLRKLAVKAQQKSEEKRRRELEEEAKKALPKTPKTPRPQSKAACDKRVEDKELKTTQYNEALDWCAANKPKGAKACTELSPSK
jgi:hypothetical protein